MSTIWVDNHWALNVWDSVWAQANDATIATELLGTVSAYAALGSLISSFPALGAGPTISPALTGNIAGNPVTSGALS